MIIVEYGITVMIINQTFSIFVGGLVLALAILTGLLHLTNLLNRNKRF